jgi:hypothetical protein
MVSFKKGGGITSNRSVATSLNKKKGKRSMKPDGEDTKNDVTEENVQEESAIIYLPGGLLAVRLPQITANPMERLIVLRWYVEEGEEVQPGQFIVKVATMYDRIDMPMPPLEGRYRIHRIEKQAEEILVMGEVFVTLQALDASYETTYSSRPTEAAYAAQAAGFQL